MKKSRLLTIIVVSVSIFAQNHKSFAEFDKSVNKEVGEYYGDKEKISEVFNQERVMMVFNPQRADDFSFQLFQDDLKSAVTDPTSQVN